MEGREDPLERIAREESQKKGNAGGLKKVVTVLAAVAAVLGGVLVYQMIKNNGYSRLVTELNVEKDSLTRQFEALQVDYANLTSDYENINASLDSSRQEVSMLVDKLKSTDATNRAMMRKYQAELGTLRSIMRNYITQIDSLNTLNHKLTEEAALAKRDAAESRRKNETLNRQVENLSSQVKTGSVIKARGLSLAAYRNNGKVTNKAGQTARMMVSLSLIENALAEHGPVTVYVRVLDPSGNLISDGRGTSFTSGDTTLDASASREVDYEGSEVDMNIYINATVKFVPGTYTMEAFTESGRLGSSALSLK